MILPSHSCISSAAHTSVYPAELLVLAFALERKDQDKAEQCPGSRNGDEQQMEAANSCHTGCRQCQKL